MGFSGTRHPPVQYGTLKRRPCLIWSRHSPCATDFTVSCSPLSSPLFHSMTDALKTRTKLNFCPALSCCLRYLPSLSPRLWNCWMPWIFITVFFSNKHAKWISESFGCVTTPGSLTKRDWRGKWMKKRKGQRESRRCPGQFKGCIPSIWQRVNDAFQTQIYFLCFNEVNCE